MSEEHLEKIAGEFGFKTLKVCKDGDSLVIRMSTNYFGMGTLLFACLITLTISCVWLDSWDEGFTWKIALGAHILCLIVYFLGRMLFAKIFSTKMILNKNEIRIIDKSLYSKFDKTVAKDDRENRPMAIYFIHSVCINCINDDSLCCDSNRKDRQRIYLGRANNCYLGVIRDIYSCVDCFCVL